RAEGDDRAAMRVRLAVAASEAELPDARRHLHAALADPRGRVDVLTRLAGLQALTGGDAGLAERLDAEAAAAADEATRVAIAVAALDVVSPRDAGRRARGLEPGEPVLARAVEAHRAWAALQEPDATADRCASLA